VLDGDGPVLDEDDFGRFNEDGDGFTAMSSPSPATPQKSRLPLQ
jgi:hypothetical protein